MTTILADLRYAARGLTRNPGFTAIAVLTLALGIGANAAIFSVVRTVLLRPLPFPQPEQLVQIWESRIDRGWTETSFSDANFWDMHDMLFQNQPYFGLENLIAYANAIGLDIGAFTSDLETHRHIPKIREDFMGGARSGVNGTPTLFINGERFDNPADEALLTRAIDAARRHRYVEASP